MQRFNRSPLFFGVALLCLAITSFAAAKEGTHTGGGGDAQTEAKFFKIRNDLLEWVKTSGPEHFKFKVDMTVEKYRELMVPVLEFSKVKLNLLTEEEERVLSAENSDYAVKIGNQSKVCVSRIFHDDQEWHMVCRTDKFNDLSEKRQYRQLHHEYAIIVGVEENQESDSNYTYSNRLTSFVSTRPETYLAVLPDDEKQYPDQSVECRYRDRNRSKEVSTVSFHYLVHYQSAKLLITKKYGDLEFHENLETVCLRSEDSKFTTCTQTTIETGDLWNCTARFWEGLTLPTKQTTTTTISIRIPIENPAVSTAHVDVKVERYGGLSILGDHSRRNASYTDDFEVDCFFK